MERRDVVIVGGGPAGSSCALALRASGLSVTVLDRRAFPRDKTCAGWVTPQVFESLDLDPRDYAKGYTLQPILGFRVQRMGDPVARVDFPEIVSWGIRRCEFDAALLERCGAELRLGTPVRRLEPAPGGGFVLDRALHAGVLVGAGGHFCPVARRLATTDAATEPIVAAQEIEFELSGEQERRCPVDPEVPEIFFTRDLRGYGWLFRKGRFLNVGLGRQDRHRLGEHLRDFLAFLREAGRLPFPIRDAFAGHAYLLHGESPRALLGDGWLLVGDACGLAYPRSGEGIRPAVESGILAARAILAADGHYEAPRLECYAATLEARFGKRRPRFRPGLSDLLPAPVAERVAGRLLASPRFARDVVVRRWFVHADTPAITL